MPVTAKALCSLVCLLVFLLPAPLLAETLPIPGTGDGPAALQTLGADLSMQNPGIKIEVPKSTTENGSIKGSGGEFEAAGTGHALRARIAREIKAKEHKYGLIYKAFAKAPAVFFSPREVQVEYLSSQQICDIKRGEPVNYCREWNSNQLKGS